jgi:hypothetical protein
MIFMKLGAKHPEPTPRVHFFYVERGRASKRQQLFFKLMVEHAASTNSSGEVEIPVRSIGPMLAACAEGSLAPNPVRIPACFVRSLLGLKHHAGSFHVKSSGPAQCRE